MSDVVNPDIEQANHARARVDSTWLGNAESNAALDGACVAYTKADWSSPQVFAKHPAIAMGGNDAIVGGDAAPSLPGRPVTGWDGEPGASAPIGAI